MLASLRETVPAEISHEIILVDDGSTDGTREWLLNLRDEPFKVLLNEKNLGYAGANNRAAAVARGDALVLLNNDLVLPENWLQPMLNLLNSGADQPGIVGNVQLAIATGEVDHRGIFINSKAKPEHDRRPLPWLSKSCSAVATTGACLAISNALWREVGGFDEGYRNGCEDVDLCLKARASGRSTAIALRSVIGHHVSSSPGRKKNDEANTRRLFGRWRNELVHLGARAWCQEYIARELVAGGTFAAPVSSAKIFAHAQGWTNRAPDVAVAGLELAIDREMARWSVMLDH